MLLRFCPACGKEQPQADAVKFCPFCGENLANLSATIKAPVEPVAAQVKTAAEVASCYDQFVTELQTQGLDEVEFRRQAAEMFAKLKAQVPSRPDHVAQMALSADRPTPVLADDEPYSVVLKSCGNKERLTKRLSEVLRRSPVATRMAVDMVPCVIIYKGKAKDIQAATAIFDEENLPYAVIKGDFAIGAALEMRIPGFTNLDDAVQLMLRKVPAALWLGEQISLVIPEVELADEPGTLVVGDVGLYLLNEPVSGRPPEWRIIPYSHLAEVNLEDNREGTLELVYKQYGLEEQLLIDDDRKFEQLYRHIQQALSHEATG